MDEDDDFLSMDAIAKLARESIPAHYELLGVHLETGAVAPTAIPGSMVIRIEFRSLLPEDLRDTPDDIRAFQGWANPLIAKIRTQWPRDEIAIGFHETKGIGIGVTFPIDESFAAHRQAGRDT